MFDLIGYINREQLIKTGTAAVIAGALAAAGVVLTDLPKIIDATAPLAAMIITGLWQLHNYLKSGYDIEPIGDDEK